MTSSLNVMEIIITNTCTLNFHYIEERFGSNFVKLSFFFLKRNAACSASNRHEMITIAMMSYFMVDSLGVFIQVPSIGSLMENENGMPLRAKHVSPCPFPHFACRFSLENDS